MLKIGYFKQTYTLKLFIALEMVYYFCFSFGGNLDNLDFFQKKFYNINSWPIFSLLPSVLSDLTCQT